VGIEKVDEGFQRGGEKVLEEGAKGDKEGRENVHEAVWEVGR
jgi:hypothetical protein